MPPIGPSAPRPSASPAGTVRGLAGIVEIDTVERRGKAVGITLPALFAVGDDVESGALLIADREQSGVVLRRLEPCRIDEPKIVRTHARHLLGKLGLVDQPDRLGIGADQGRW